MKIGIMGGTFDPIHLGHLILAEEAKQQYQLDTVYIMPNGNPKYKKDRVVTDASIRIRMAELAVADNPNLELSTIEVERTGYTYTYETLEQLRREHPGHQYYFIIGADSLFTIDTWKYPERIFKNCILLAANRNQVPDANLYAQMDFLKKQYKAEIYSIDLPAIGISSEMIRRRRKNGQNIHYYVPDRVYHYMIEHGLYL